MKLFSTGLSGALLASLLFATLPSSSSYQLNNYGFGSGGTSGSSSSNYKVNGTTGETSNTESTSANYKARSGVNNTQQANVPNAPTFTNPASYYNKLVFTVMPGGTSPTDTKYSIAISTDNFVTTNYVQLDDTIGSGRVYQTYAAWGGASGQTLVGLTPSTTYKLRVNAIQGNFTETEFGPTATAATVAPTITFDIDTAASNTETSAPYALNFTSLLPGTVVGSTEKIWVDLDTNAVSGAGIYIRSLNSGLKSTRLNSTIASASADLAAASTGYGAQSSSVTQTSGGPLSASSPYNGAAQNVGILDTTIRKVFSAPAPITAGRAALQIKAKASNQTPAASDYGDTLTITVAGLF